MKLVFGFPMTVMIVMISMVLMAAGHGAMTFPPARNTPTYDWHSANKGAQEGVWTDASTHACGAPQYIMPGPVVATFTAGQIINIEVTISTYHDGYYEFRLCVPKGVNDQPPTTNQGMLDCLMDPATPILKRVNPLPAGSRSTYKMFTPPVWTAEQLAIRWRQTPQDGIATGKSFGGHATHSLQYRLPENVECRNCVLHWYWQSLNNWQEGPANTLGTTTGERFWNCADITITSATGTPLPPPPTHPGDCFDGVMNQGETDVDCGGPCAPCVVIPPPMTSPSTTPPTTTPPTTSPTTTPTPTPPPSTTPALPTGTYTVWVSTAKYWIGSIVSFNGQYYRCITEHTANSWWTPSTTPTLWQLLPSCIPTTQYALESEGVTEESIQKSTTQESNSNGASGSDTVPGWAIALICLGVAIVGTQICYFIWRYKRDAQLDSAQI